MTALTTRLSCAGTVLAVAAAVYFTASGTDGPEGGCDPLALSAEITTVVSRAAPLAVGLKDLASALSLSDHSVCACEQCRSCGACGLGRATSPGW